MILLKNNYIKHPLFLAFWIFSILIWGSLSVNAQDFPPAPNPPRLVNDFANLLTPPQRENLENKLVQFSKSTSNQITIVTIDQLNGLTASQYATQLGIHWGVGKKGKENGVVVLVAAQDRKMNISPGYGLESVLTDAMCGRIIRNEMAPAFREGNYYKGLDKASDAIIAATQGAYTADSDEVGSSAIPIILVIIIIVLFLIFFYFGNKFSDHDDFRGGKGGDYFKRNNHIIFGPGLGTGWGGFRGGGGFGGGSSGGFGGFGGGSFGGGGASGSW